MRCLKPRSVGFLEDGKTISWSFKKCSKEYPTFKLPCGKCIECRLEYARQWAIRCVHEAKMYENNSFITLTYEDKHLESPKLIYRHFQDFMKKLRDEIFRETTEKNFGQGYWSQLSQAEKKLHLKNQKEIYEQSRIGFFVTGEYGDQKKRPHWHALIFNYRPSDLTYKYTNDNGDRVYHSESLTRRWGKGIAEVGSITFQSAGYVARYASKKLVHGKDGTHEYDPISKKSNRSAIGKKWLERFWKDAFHRGSIVLINGQETIECAIPRYYEKWLNKNHPEAWKKYVTGLKEENCNRMSTKQEKEDKDRLSRNQKLLEDGLPVEIDPSAVRAIIIEDKFKTLQKHLKGDI